MNIVVYVLKKMMVIAQCVQKRVLDTAKGKNFDL